MPVRVLFSKSTVFKICRQKICRFRVNGRCIRHIFHRFQNAPASCERSLNLDIVLLLFVRFRSFPNQEFLTNRLSLGKSRTVCHEVLDVFNMQQKYSRENVRKYFVHEIIRANQRDSVAKLQIDLQRPLFQAFVHCYVHHFLQFVHLLCLLFSAVVCSLLCPLFSAVCSLLCPLFSAVVCSLSCPSFSAICLLLCPLFSAVVCSLLCPSFSAICLLLCPLFSAVVCSLLFPSFSAICLLLCSLFSAVCSLLCSLFSAVCLLLCPLFSAVVCSLLCSLFSAVCLLLCSLFSAVCLLLCSLFSAVCL